MQKVNGLAGSENHLLALLPRLRDHGYQSTMLVLADRNDRPGTFVERMQAVGIPTKVTAMLGDLDPLLFARLVRFIWQGRYHLVHTHLLHAGLYGRLAGRIAGTRVISTYHNDNPFHLTQGLKQINRVTTSMCCQVICISKAVQGFVHKQIGVPLNRLNVIYYGLEPVLFRSSMPRLRSDLGIGPTDPVVGIVARLIEQKGHIYLLQAMRFLLDDIPSVHLLIVGEGELRPYLESLTAQLRIKEHVHYLGFRTEASNLMHEFDVFVLPSLFEGFGLVLLEAMAAAKPIVATQVSAIPEIVADGETGLLVPPRDPMALAQALRQLIMNPGLACDLGHCGRRRLEQRFTVRKMVEDTVKVYQSVLCLNTDHIGRQPQDADPG
jgi:glycosyltransferase involved in cell wall biosynthesis